MEALLKYGPFAAVCLQAISVTVAAYFAVQGLRAWRHQLVGKRHFEVAEHVMIAFVEAIDAIDAARLILSTSTKNSRKADPDESPSLRQVLDSYYEPVERLNINEAKFSELRKAWTLFEIHFPEISDEPIKAIFKARYEILTTANMMMDIAREYDGVKLPDDAKNALRELKDVIFSRLKPDHPLSKSLEQARQDLNKILRKYMQV